MVVCHRPLARLAHLLRPIEPGLCEHDLRRIMFGRRIEWMINLALRLAVISLITIIVIIITSASVCF